MNKNHLNIYLYLIPVVFFILSAGCKQKQRHVSPIQNINQGSIQIASDVNYQSLTSELIKSYENVFDSARITATYASGQDVIQSFLKNEAQLIIIGRNLTPAELNNAEIAHTLRPKENIIAYEGIAIVTGLQTPDSIFDMDAFIGTIRDKKMNQYTGKQFIFQNERSGTLQYLFEKTGIQGAALDNMFAMDTLDSFLRYLNQNTNAIGFLSYAQISDKDDPEMKEILKQVKILSVVHTDSTGKRMISELSQSTIATNEYPLVRPINVVVGNISERVGSGFVNFLLKTKSARIFLKAGLIPVVIPERQIFINQENLK
ncbi:MAG: substrate-binding domain-containing protein [Chitinophagales bacterium]|nr:substrate-binding domain-containing protein [Chitinophagales bacterium]